MILGSLDMQDKTILIDIDDTLLLYPDSKLPPEQRGGRERYKDAVPDFTEIQILNKLYENNTIILFTGRGWDQYEFTKKQMKIFNIKHHQLICGRPLGIYVDRDSKKSLEELLNE
jgi:hypothetical protein